MESKPARIGPRRPAVPKVIRLQRRECSLSSGRETEIQLVSMLADNCYKGPTLTSANPLYRRHFGFHFWFPHYHPMSAN